MADVWLSRLHSARLLRLLRWGGLLLPLGVALVAGAVTWRGAVEDARAQAEVNAGLLRDYMFRLVEVHDLMLTAADAALDRARLDADGGHGMHRFLAEMQERMALGVGIALVAADGAYLLSSMAHPPTGGGGPGEYLSASYDEAPLFVDRLRVGPTGSEALVVARRRDGPRLPGVWVAGMRIEAVEDFLGGIVNTKQSVATVLRSDGRVLLRRPEGGAGLRLPANSPELQAFARAPSGVYEAVATVDGVRRIYAYARVGDTPLYALYGVSRRVLLFDWMRSFAGVLGVLGALSLTGFGLARSAGRSVEAEAAHAALAFNRRLLAEANKTAEAREMMLRELNHRVKNSLQMIRSLVRLQAQRPGGPDLDAIVPPESNIMLERRLERLTVDANVATPLALCTIELVTNAAKHAFGPEGGRIAVTLRGDGDGAVLSIADDGAGLPEAPARNSGLRVVDALVLQLGGALRVVREGGTRYEIAFASSHEGREEHDAGRPGDAAPHPAGAPA